MFFIVVGLLATTLCAQTPAAVLAPTGQLRVAFLALNPVQARIDPVTGAATGPVPDMIREIARRLGVPATMVPGTNVPAVIKAIEDGAADIGFLAVDPGRAREVDFGARFLVMPSSYLVALNSPIRRNADVDRPGVVVAAVGATTQHLFVERELRNVQVRVLPVMPAQAEVERLLTSGEVTAFAVNRQRALEAQGAAPSRLRALPESFIDVDQAVVVAKGRRDRLDVVNPLVTELVRSGFVKASAERAGVLGVEFPAP